MEALVFAGLVVVLLWMLVARRVQSWGVGAPIVLIVAGALLGGVVDPDLGSLLDTVAAEHMLEIILALVLFSDATEIRGGLLGGEKSAVLRLVLIALPLSLAAAAGVALVLLGSISWPVALVLACVLMPTDFAPAAGIARRTSPRVSEILNVECGYKDGIVAPILLFAFVAAEAAGKVSGAAAEVLWTALPELVVSLLVGLGLGAAVGLAVRWSMSHALMSSTAVRAVLMLTPVIAYAAAEGSHGNGFVSAFAAGVAYRATRARVDEGLSVEETSLVDDVSRLASLLVWFLFGATTVLALETGIQWPVVALVALALTILRAGPVMLALIGTDLSTHERLQIGFFAPRGVVSVIFGLLAFNTMREDEANLVFYTMIVLVVGSVLLHSVRLRRSRIA